MMPRRQGARRGRPFGAGTEPDDSGGGRRAASDADERRRSFRVDDGKANMARRPSCRLATGSKAWISATVVSVSPVTTFRSRSRGSSPLSSTRSRKRTSARCSDKWATVNSRRQRKRKTGWAGWSGGSRVETQSKGGRAHVRQVIEVWVKAGVIWKPSLERQEPANAGGLSLRQP